MQVYFLNDNQCYIYCIGLEKLSISSNHVFMLHKSHSQASFESKLDKAIPNACRAHIGYR